MDPPISLPKRKRPPFNPPRPRNGAGITKPSTTSARSKSKPKPKPNSTARTTTQKSASSSSNIHRRRPSTAHNNDNDDDTRASSTSSRTPSPSGPNSSPRVTPSSDYESRSRSRSPSDEPDYILAEITEPAPLDPREELESSDPLIKPKLLTTLLHRHFQDDKTKITKDAVRALAKYVDIFVREALARASYERAEGQSGKSASRDTRGGARARVDNYLEIEDLERLAPQLVLDF
ncbi:CENP-X superfamily domain-containing protein [Histoplasma capsulatum G186AR]|uniref:CENP-X superfamily domain-containing protein n=1 Tax=Ajellomyces capsulatus TaxID=5037 RepID=A0A8H7YGD9_AJECA|nr:CENP-X superfamily domain-containing protein [Histoplasma capsulatum]QSS73348.1 CENP-X superfamily domain-containing protein [Histoplasma capsulatum G186AR]